MEHRLTWDPSICPRCHPPAPEHCPGPGSEPSLWVELQGEPQRQSLLRLIFLLNPKLLQNEAFAPGSCVCLDCWESLVPLGLTSSPPALFPCPDYGPGLPLGWPTKFSFPGL